MAGLKIDVDQVFMEEKDEAAKQRAHLEYLANISRGSIGAYDPDQRKGIKRTMGHHEEAPTRKGRGRKRRKTKRRRRNSRNKKQSRRNMTRPRRRSVKRGRRL